jgi:hypothetical protein
VFAGQASKWFSSHKHFENYTYANFSRELIGRFTIRVSPHLVLHRMGKFDPTYKQGREESVETFLQRMRGELQYINNEVEHWVAVCFLYGLGQDIREQLRLVIGDDAPSIGILRAESVQDDGEISCWGASGGSNC